MTTYTAIADSEIDPESPGTTTLFTKLRNNPLAIQEGDATAPKIVTAAFTAASIATSILTADNGIGQGHIATSAIGQGELKATAGTVSTTSTTLVNLTLSGGEYGFYPQLYMSNTNTAAYQAHILDLGTTLTGWISPAVTNISIASGTGTTTYARQAYIQASPPYDLGDGAVGRFIFATIDNATGEVESVYQAQEAPWHYNGKTDIRGKIGKDGKKYRLRKDMAASLPTLSEAMNDVNMLEKYIDAFISAKTTKELVTQELLQRDMVDIPHPFTKNDLTGKTVVMLDPVSDLNHKLSEMCVHDEFNLNDLLHDGYLSIGNTPLKRNGPDGVLIPSFKWKKTK